MQAGAGGSELGRVEPQEQPRVGLTPLDAGACVPDCGRLPTLLYVFPDPAREARVRPLIRAAFAGLPSVPVLTTNVGMLRAYGPCGPSWWSPTEQGWRSWVGGETEREERSA